MYNFLINIEKDMIQKTKESLEEWDGSLQARGGVLSIEKSSWYVVDFTYKNNR